jgi:hypothetical protein
MRLPPCFLFFHFEEDEVVFGCSTSSASGLVHSAWRLNKSVLIGHPSFEENMGWHFIHEHLLQTPEMISQPTRHRRCTSLSSMLFLAQLLMRPAQIVGTSNQIHGPLKRLQAYTGMTTFSR